MRIVRWLLGLCLALGLAASVQAAAPDPKKPIDFDRMMGRWYEVARTRNDRQRDCYAAWSQWTLDGSGKAKVANHCRKGSPTGRDDVVNASARLVDARRARIHMTFYFGAIGQEYWILDHADDYSWSIMATPGGNYVWIFSRKKNLSAGERDALVDRAVAFGYPKRKMDIGK